MSAVAPRKKTNPRRSAAQRAQSSAVDAFRNKVVAQGKARPCGVLKSNGERCRNKAGHDTSHPGYGACRVHGGDAPNHQRNAAKSQALDEAKKVMGDAIDIDPFEAILWCVKIAAGEVMFSSQMIERLSLDEAIVQFTEVEESDGDLGAATRKVTRTDTTLNVWIVTRQNAMDRLARFSKMAIDCGIAERHVRIAEEIGGLIGRMIRGVLGDLELTPAQAKRAPEIVQRHLMTIEGTASEASPLPVQPAKRTRKTPGALS